MEQVNYNAIGIPSAPAILTADYADNQYEQIDTFLSNSQINFSYTPKTGETNRKLYILPEVSNDGGTTWFPMAGVSDGTTKRTVSTVGAESTSGVPYEINGAVGGTTYKGFIPLPAHGEKIRISAKEDGVADFGTLFVNLSLSS